MTRGHVASGVGGASASPDERPRATDSAGWRVFRWPTAAGGAWAMGVTLTTFAALALGADARLCVFHNATGCPCATCGSTRAVLALGRGEPLAALAHNPLTTLLAIGTLALLMTRRRAWTVAALLHATGFWWTLLALLGVNWAYLLWRHANG